MGTTIEEIIDSLKKGQGKRIKNLVKLALEEGISEQEIVEQGFLEGMAQLTNKFRQQEVGVPEILSITRALEAGIAALHSYTGHKTVKEIGTAVIGTVEGDMHDIGKNLIKMMLENRNFQVIDLGAGVSPTKFYDEAAASKAEVVCISGLLSDSVERMRQVIEEFEDHGNRERFYIMVGGNAMNKELADAIGADCYTEDACQCAEIASRYVGQKGRKKRILS